MFAIDELKTAAGNFFDSKLILIENNSDYTDV